MFGASSQMGGLDMTAAAQARAMQNYQPPQPKEIGVLDRIGGLANGLDELQLRLESFTARLSGGPSAGKSETPTPCGINAQLSHVESRLRECLALVGKLNDAF